MKSINNYISEKLVINRNTKASIGHTYFPKSTEELALNILDIFDENRNEDIIDLNCIDISNHNIESLSYLFNTLGLENIKKIDISNWDVSNIKYMTSMFKNCKKLESIGDISNWNTKSLYGCAFMFNNCINLRHIGDISNWNTSNLHNINYMFYGCEKLSDIGDLNKWDISKIDKKYYMNLPFGGCKKTIIPNWI